MTKYNLEDFKKWLEEKGKLYKSSFDLDEFFKKNSIYFTDEERIREVVDEVWNEDSNTEKGFKVVKVWLEETDQEEESMSVTTDEINKAFFTAFKEELDKCPEIKEQCINWESFFERIEHDLNSHRLLNLFTLFFSPKYEAFTNNLIILKGFCKLNKEELEKYLKEEAPSETEVVLKFHQLTKDNKSFALQIENYKKELEETKKLLSERDNTSLNQQSQEKIASLEQEKQNLTEALDNINKEKQQLENRLSNMQHEAQTVRNQFNNAANLKFQFTELQTKYQQLTKQLANETKKNKDLQEQINKNLTHLQENNNQKIWPKMKKPLLIGGSIIGVFLLLLLIYKFVYKKIIR